jgi:putative endonuclease
MADKSWFVYMLRCADGTLYTGCTTDLQARLVKHNAGVGAKYTRSRLPLSIVYSESVPTRSDALKREAAIKKLSRDQKMALVTGK